MQSPHLPQSPGQDEVSIRGTSDDVESGFSPVTRTISANENGGLAQIAKSSRQSRYPEPLKLLPTSEDTSSKQERMTNGLTTGFDISLSSENDRTALTRYTNQTLTSLAAYRDALIDENGRLHAMLMNARTGLEVVDGAEEVDELEDENVGQDAQDDAQESTSHKRTTSVMDLIKESMVEELQQLRKKAALLKKEERSVSNPAPGRRDSTSARHDLRIGPVTASEEDPAMMVYYSIVNKLRSDLDTSRKQRDDAKNTLTSTCREMSGHPPHRSRAADRLRNGRTQRLWHGRHGNEAVVGQSLSSHTASRRPEELKKIFTDAFEAELVNIAEDGSLLPLITDQEESVWLRERRERDMEKTLRDMRCYVEAMIREWREVGSLPPPGKYQTLSFPDLNLPYIPSQIFPKRKGRPPRASVKVQQIPENLQHLLARSRASRTADSQKERDRERFKMRLEPMPYSVADALTAQRNAKRKGKDRTTTVDDLDEDAARKRRRELMGTHASEYEDDAVGSITRSPRNHSMDASNAELMHTGETTPDRQEGQLSADQLYGVSASAISDAMQAYTQQPMQDDTSVFGPAGMPEQSFETEDASFDTQIPYQVQMAQRRSLGFPTDVNVPDTLVNGGNVFDNPDDMQLASAGDHQHEHQHETVNQYASSNPFRGFDQSTEDSVEGIIQQHIRDAQASAEQADSALIVDSANLEVSDAQQALDQYRFEEALMNHDIASPEDQHANSILTGGMNPESADATAIAAQRLMNSLAPHAAADFDSACQNCGRRDTIVWRKLTVNGVDYKVCNACGLHYQKNGVMRPRSLWGDVAAQPRKRRSQRPFGSSVPSDQQQDDPMIGDALYETGVVDENGQYGEPSSYEPHFPEGQYGIDEEAALTTDDLPQYELNLDQ